MRKLQQIILASIGIINLIACSAQQIDHKGNNGQLVNRTNIENDSLVKVLDSLEVNYQFRGNCYAYSSDQNKIPSNGEAHSTNLALKITDEFYQDSVYLYINREELVKINETQIGFKLYLVNAADSAMHLSAQDSRINIIAQALNEDGDWEAISYLPNSWCGNSYHKVILGNDEYWSFNIPIFKGEFKTKLRYVLLMDSIEGAIVSNEIETRINLNQFNEEKKQGHHALDIMDPYEE